MAEVSKETAELVRSVYDPYLSTREMGKEIGVSQTTVRHALQVLGLPTRRRFCPKTYDIANLDPIWAAEFRGFFYADGYAGLDLKQNGNISPIMLITQRADSRIVLADIQDKLGGKLTYVSATPVRSNTRYTANPQWKWRVCSWSVCKAVIEATDLVDGLLPARKRLDLEIFRDAIAARFRMPRDRLTKTQKDILSGYREAIRSIKRFQL